MHSLKELDGRYKVANVVGHTMQYHPHGASIGDAMVQIGQRITD
jgi:topoisomerase-4 subunit A